MSIFDRFWGTTKKTDQAPSALAPVAQPGAATADRRNRKRKNARQGAKALIIDDSATVVAALRKILRSAGYTTSEAADAEQGLLLIEQDKPDLIFLDIILPGMNGFGALRVIRKDPATQHIPVIMISGNEHATEQFYANRIGADDFMKKPFSRFEVFARIENLLDAHRVPRRKGEASLAPSSVAAQGQSLPEGASQQPRAQAVGHPPTRLPGASAESVTLHGAPAAGAGSAPSRWSALDARKELTAMGLQYFDQAQFFAAIRRGDQLAVELYVAAGGVAVDEPMDGQTALGLATAMDRPGLVRLLAASAQPSSAGSVV